MPKFKNASWRDERLPEMLWAALLVTGLPRDEALSIFRKLANYVAEQPDRSAHHDITHTGIAVRSAESAKALIGNIAFDSASQNALKPLMLLHGLPGRALWAEYLGGECEAARVSDLMTAVARTLWHQSDESTDCRWVRVLCDLTSGRFHAPEGFARKILDYPEGDLREVRPLVRSAEIGMQFPMFETSREWPQQFWAECLEASPCMTLVKDNEDEPSQFGTTPDTISRCRHALAAHWNDTKDTTAIDAEHDALFGAAFYCLAIIEEIRSDAASHSITGRVALRTILECYITMRYLIGKRDPELWRVYRAYGAGQAKLAFLKLQEVQGGPQSIDTETLRELANEDFWEEFVAIELGNWGKSNLRQLSEQAGAKEDYDRFYGWSSTFAHAHWCAVRDAVFDTCGNPLHRLHRIPRLSPRRLGNALADACLLTDRVIDLLSNRYPIFPYRVTIFYGRPS